MTGISITRRKEMVDTQKSKLTVTTPSDLEIKMVRSFDAPRELVFKAFTDPKLMAQWWGPRDLTVTVEQMDVRPGGAWRVIHRSADGEEYAFRGEYREVVPPERITWTFEFEPWAGHGSVETATFEEKDGKTTVTSISTFDSMEDRDQMLNSGMEGGASESYDRLDELLETM
jgi:uncharacterized protein YndB with AHSA1/START domain